MRDLSPWAIRSTRRAAHRRRYATYMVSPAWYRRREQWASAEQARLDTVQLTCAGCDAEWHLARDDLHHVDYGRLGDEAHEDLWAMCRRCHSWLHDLIASTWSWRRIPFRHANELALANLQHALRDPEGHAAVMGLRDFL